MRYGIAGYQHHSISGCLGLRLRWRRAFWAPLLWCQCQHSGRRPSTHLGSSFTTAVLVPPTELLFGQHSCACVRRLCQHIYTGHKLHFAKPFTKLVKICAPAAWSHLPSPSLAFPCDSFNDHACACEQKIIILGAGCVHVCVRGLLCAGSAHWCSQLHSCALLKLTQRRRGNTQQDPGLSLA